jgi:hypothetical protein
MENRCTNNGSKGFECDWDKHDKYGHMEFVGCAFCVSEVRKTLNKEDAEELVHEETFD